MAERRCVYTVLTAGYEALREQPLAHESDLDFVAFTDVDVESDTWEVRRFDPVFPDDPRRSQNVLRLLAHRCLPDHDLSIYVDNTVTFARVPEALLELVPPDALIAGCPGPMDTLLRAFENVAARGLSAPDTLHEQLRAYQATYPELLDQPYLQPALLVRRHHHPDVVAAMEQWLFHVLRYTARNALSHTVAFAQVGVAHHAFPFLLRDNEYVDPPDRTSRVAHEARTDTVEPFDLEHGA